MSTRKGIKKPAGMTVSELAAALQAMEVRGEGRSRVLIPFDRVMETIGGIPARAVAGAHVGFDWDKGRVFLEVEERRLTEPADDQQAFKRELRELRRIVQWEIPRILAEADTPAERKLARIEQWIARANPKPKSEKGESTSA